ncbi:MAG: IS256 family transposase [Nitrospiraceae bacterium]
MSTIVRTNGEAQGSEQAVATALDELAREGARRMILAALEVEVEEYRQRYHDARDAGGHALVVRNGQARPRRLTVGAGTVTLRAPRINDQRVRDGVRQKFTSAILPPYARRSGNVSAVLPLLYLHGLSTGDFREALPVLLGEDAAGLSPAAITRLTTSWRTEYAYWRARSLAACDFIYVWVDGVHFNIRLEDDRLAALVVVGVRPDGTKEVIAIEDGYRESTESWLAVLRDLKTRGMPAPALAIGDGALGFWAALREVWPKTREQRCWVHRIANVLDKLPTRLQPQAKRALHEMMYAESQAACETAIHRFVRDYEAKYPKAVKSLVTDVARLLTHFDFPVAHWKHLRSTNPIESTFATVKHRTRVTKGAGSRAAGLTMAFKLLETAQRTWRRIDAHDLLRLVRAGVVFKDGQLVERTESQSEKHTRRVAA